MSPFTSTAACAACALLTRCRIRSAREEPCPLEACGPVRPAYKLKRLAGGGIFDRQLRETSQYDRVGRNAMATRLFTIVSI